MGRCKLNNDTVVALKAVGGEESKSWKKFDIEYWEAWHPVPFIVGELVKA
jgi:hypothetical protein